MSIPSFKLVACPACKKQRLNKEILPNGTVDAILDTTFQVRGETRYLDACNFCLIKYQKRDALETRKNLELLKTSRDNATLDL